jgi:recombination endonuclease VII
MENEWEDEWDYGDMPKIKYENISFIDRMKFFKQQGGACALCRIKFEGYTEGGGKLDPVVDHCHNTGYVRGLLCSTCNTALGYAEKRGSKFLERVSDYFSQEGDIFHTNGYYGY